LDAAHPARRLDDSVLAGVYAGIFIAGVIVWRYGRRTVEIVRGIGAPGVAAACLSTFATIMYINAFRRTSVADVMIKHAEEWLREAVSER